MNTRQLNEQQVPARRAGVVVNLLLIFDAIQRQFLDHLNHRARAW